VSPACSDCTTNSSFLPRLNALDSVPNPQGAPVAPRKPFAALARIRSSSPSPGSTPTPPANSRSTTVLATVKHSDRSYDRAYRPANVEERHPYANPDLDHRQHPTPHLTTSSANHSSVSRSDSVSTVTDSQTNSLSASQTFSSSKDSHYSAPSSPRSAIAGKDISSPLAIQSSPFRPSLSSSSSSSHVIGRPGWADQGATPAFNLISLEEARAQRSRSATNQTPPRPGSSESRMDDSASVKARARSMSAGSKARLALGSVVGSTPKFSNESESLVSQQKPTGPGRTIKHKKSGLMRLFNGGKEDKSPPPPVPALSDSYTSYNTQQPAPQQRSRKESSHRVPVPSLSPSVQEPEQLSASLSTAKPDQTLKRFPALSLTVPTSRSVSAQPSALTPNPTIDSIPQSAPAHVSGFPSLKLRPISTAFSSQFGEDFISRESLVSPDGDWDTPSSASPNTLHSPVTPSSYSKISTGSERADDQTAVIRALQDQIVSTKKAWQRHIWELEGQVRDLRAELEELKAEDVAPRQCAYCGRSKDDTAVSSEPISVLNRPRARTGNSGTNARFGCPD
jgi:hypothetical protein